MNLKLTTGITSLCKTGYVYFTQKYNGIHLTVHLLYNLFDENILVYFD